MPIFVAPNQRTFEFPQQLFISSFEYNADTFNLLEIK